MQDPKPDNIMGQKRVSHSVEWQINVGYAILGLLGLYVAFKLSSSFAALGSEDEENDQFSEQIDQLSDSASRIDVA